MRILVRVHVDKCIVISYSETSNQRAGCEGALVMSCRCLGWLLKDPTNRMQYCPIGVRQFWRNFASLSHYLSAARCNGSHVGLCEYVNDFQLARPGSLKDNSRIFHAYAKLGSISSFLLFWLVEIVCRSLCFVVYAFVVRDGDPALQNTALVECVVVLRNMQAAVAVGHYNWKIIFQDALLYPFP